MYPDRLVVMYNPTRWAHSRLVTKTSDLSTGPINSTSDSLTTLGDSGTRFTLGDFVTLAMELG